MYIYKNTIIQIVENNRFLQMIQKMSVYLPLNIKETSIYIYVYKSDIVEKK